MKHKILQDLNIEELYWIYIISSVPSFLYRKYKENESIIKISEKYSKENIIKYLDFFIDNRNNDYKNLIAMYSLLVIITDKYKELPEKIKDFNYEEWGWFFKNLIDK